MERWRAHWLVCIYAVDGGQRRLLVAVVGSLETALGAVVAASTPALLEERPQVHNLVSTQTRCHEHRAPDAKDDVGNITPSVRRASQYPEQ